MCGADCHCHFVSFCNPGKSNDKTVNCKTSLLPWLTSRFLQSLLMLSLFICEHKDSVRGEVHSLFFCLSFTFALKWLWSGKYVEDSLHFHKCTMHPSPFTGAFLQANIRGGVFVSLPKVYGDICLELKECQGKHLRLVKSMHRMPYTVKYCYM
jgi:hypothetical protein